MAAAVKDGIFEHVRALESRGTTFYGYALLPGKSYDIRNLTAVTNSKDRIRVPHTHESYRYHQYSVDEWANWEHDGFKAAAGLLGEANGRFAAMHGKGENDFRMDEFEVAYSDSLLEAILKGFEAAKSAGAFGREERFLAMWISSSRHSIMAESVRRLNRQAVVDEFLAEFG